MKAVYIEEFGPPEGLSVTDRPAPVPGPGQLLIATEAAGVGGVDAVIRRGTIGGSGMQVGDVPGSEVAGTVTAAGEGADPAWIGRRVWAFTGRTGGYAEQAVAAVDDVQPLPDGLSAVDAVTLGSAGVVAHFALARAQLAPGESVLVRGAGGSIGIMTVQLAAQGGAGAVAVTTSSPERGARLRALGATHVLDRSGDGDGPAAYDIVIDIVGGPGLPGALGLLAPNGRMVVVGVVGGYPPADFGMALLAGFRRSPTFSTLSLDTVPGPQRQAVRGAQFEAAVRGELTSVVHEVLPLDDAALAHRRMDDGEVFGRIVLTP